MSHTISISVGPDNQDGPGVSYTVLEQVGGEKEAFDSGGWASPSSGPRRGPLGQVSAWAWVALLRRHVRLPRAVREAGLGWDDADLELAPREWNEGWERAYNGVQVTWTIPELPSEITLEQLEGLRVGGRPPCQRQVDLFVATFGERAQVTAANLRRARRVGLDVEWLAKALGISALRAAA